LGRVAGSLAELLGLARLVAELVALKRRGLSIALILTEPSPDDLGLPRQHGITSYGLWRDGRPRAG